MMSLVTLATVYIYQYFYKIKNKAFYTLENEILYQYGGKV